MGHMNIQPKSKTIDPNQRVDIEILGLSGLLNPFIQNTSSQRARMFIGHLNGRLFLPNAEFPNVFSGYELETADYTFDTLDIDEPIEIIKVIYKFKKLSVDKNPMITVIFKRMNSNVIDYANIYKYVRTKETYSFINSFDRISMLSEGNIIYPDDEIVYPTNKDPDTGEYKTGVNVNTAYMTLLDTYEDAMVISESLAKKLSTIQINSTQFEIDFDKYPLNLYGNDDEYKPFPDIGETIREDGIVSAFRKIDKKFMLVDMTPDNLCKVNYFHDKINYGYSNATIIDIDVYMTKKLSLLKIAYDQFKKYAQYKLEYYQDIFDVYRQYANDVFSPKLNTLFTNSIKFLLAAGTKLHNANINARFRNVGLHAKDTPIKLLTKITYLYTLPCDCGFKITDRNGGKGVICKILPDDKMPKDEYGIKADLIVDDPSVVKRTNLGQLYEQFLTRASQLILFRIQNLPDNKKFQTILEYLNDINPEYAQMVYEAYGKKVHQFLDEVSTNQLKIWVKTASRQITIDKIKLIKEKWKIDKTPVTLQPGDYLPNKIKTKQAISIGSKYIYLLYNLPNVNVLSIGLTNQFDLPTKTRKIKVDNINLTPVRFFGQDETRILINSTVPQDFVRLKYLNCFSEKGRRVLIKTILSSTKPSAISRIPIDLVDLKRSSTVHNTVMNIFSLAGVDLRNVICDNEND